jgi:hypothetical protein
MIIDLENSCFRIFIVGQRRTNRFVRRDFWIKKDTRLQPSSLPGRTPHTDPPVTPPRMT